MKKLTKEDIQKYATSKEIRIFEKIEQEKALESADVDNVVVTRYRKRMSDGSVVYDIHISDFKTPNAPAVIMCTDARSSKDTFEALITLLNKA